jgi:hypothetical protein
MSQILDKIGIPKPFLPTPDNIDVFRQRWSAGTTRFVNSPVAKQALASGGGINWSQHDIRIPARDGDGISARVHTPNDRHRDGAPAMVIFHGGGWCLEGLDTEEFQCQLWCQRLGVVVGNVAYRLAPEYKFPVLPYDAYDSVRCVGILGIGAEDVTDDCVGCKECSELWCKPGERLHCWWILWRCDIRCYGQSPCKGR